MVLSVVGTGPAAQAAAYHAAGVRLRTIADALGLPLPVASQLVLGFWLHASRPAGLSLTDRDDGRCMVDGCSRPRDSHRLCWAHLSRFYAGRPALPGPAHPPVRLQQCQACGAQWCRLTKGRTPKTCGSRQCRSTLHVRSAPPGRQQEILRRVRDGEPYRTIAADYGISDRRISQIANRAGLFRRRNQSAAQRAALARPAPDRPTRG